MVLLHCVFVRVIARGKGHYGPVRAIALGETAWAVHGWAGRPGGTRPGGGAPDPRRL